MNTEKCNEWAEQRKSPKPKNPLTNRVIKKGGPKYKELDKECDKFIVDINSICKQWLKDNHSTLYDQLDQNKPKKIVRISPEVSIRQISRSNPSIEDSENICDEWAEQRENSIPRNPRTQRAIKKGGPKYRELEKECDEFLPLDQRVSKALIASPLPKWLKTRKSPRLPSLRQPPPLQESPPPLRQPSPTRQPQPPVPKWLKEKPSPRQASPPPLRQPQPDSVSVEETVDSASVDSVPLGLRVPRSKTPSSTANFKISERKKMGTTIKKYFASVILEDGKACMTDSKTLLKYVQQPEVIGFGAFGTVYKVTIPQDNLPVAIKEGRISQLEYKKALKKKYPMEYLFNKLTNDLLDDLVCPNFAYSYVIFFCNKCTLQLVPGAEDLASNKSDGGTPMTECSETVVELWNSTLKASIINPSNEVVETLLFQILFALSSLQLKYGINHNDLKPENILIKFVPEGGYWNYNLDDEMYHVPNYGYIAAIADFGIAMSFKPGISQGEYGNRQAEVVLNPDTGEYSFKPFTTKRSPMVDWAVVGGGITEYRKPFTLVDARKLTKNTFYKGFDSQPSIPVDLEDFRRFPAYSFNTDMMNIITIVRDPDLGLTRDDHILKWLKDFREISSRYKWPTNEVYLFLANHAIRKLFPFYTNNDVDGPPIETYNL